MTKKKRFWTVVGLAALLPIIFAILDNIGYNMWKSLGGFAGEAYTTASPHYMALFWGFAWIMIAAIAITYYLIRRDKSEALAIFLVPAILLQFGLEDIFYYIFMGIPIDQTLPWLTQNLWPPTIISWILGATDVTNTGIIISAIIGIILTYYTTKYLLKKKW